MFIAFLQVNKYRARDYTIERFALWAISCTNKENGGTTYAFVLR